MCGLGKREKSRKSPTLLTLLMEGEVLPLTEMWKCKGRENLEILKRASFVKGFYLGHVKSEMPIRHPSGDA